MNSCRRSSLGVLLLLMLATSLFASSVFAASAQTNSSWLNWASIAWRYFQPGVGINPTTGLNRANLDWDYATDWDIASSIISVIMARRIGLIGDTTPTGWGYRDRINRILSGLEDRPLGTVNGVPWPYWAYNWNGSGCGTYCDNYTGAADSARLLIALNMLRNFDQSYATRVEAIYERAKGAYDVMAHEFGVGYYQYYMAMAYEEWGYNETASLQGFEELKNSSTINVYGIHIPAISTIAEPTVLVLLELNRSLVSPTFADLAQRIYETQEARYSNTGLLTAWSEGEYFKPPYYVYETIYDPDVPYPGTWVIPIGNQVLVPPLRPIMYTKIAFSYLAIYGSNAYTNALADTALSLAGPSGFGEGTFEDGSRAPWSQGSLYSDKTNGLVLAASAYALTGGNAMSATTGESAASTNTAIPILLAVTVTITIVALVMIFNRRRKDPRYNLN